MPVPAKTATNDTYNRDRTIDYYNMYNVQVKRGKKKHILYIKIVIEEKFDKHYKL